MNCIKQARVILMTSFAFCQAWWIKLRKDMTGVRFVSLPNPDQKNDLEIQFVRQWAERWVRYGAIFTGRKCFFRAYIMGHVLSRLGYFVEMNVGIRIGEKSHAANGHCWLTLNGCPLYEKSDPLDIYPSAITRTSNGIRYWVGPRFESLKRGSG